METQENEFSHKWEILLAVMSGGFMASVDGSVVNLILPTLVNYFNSGFSNIQWVVLSYLLVVASLILSMGRLGDVIGRKKVYLTGFFIFTFGSFLCGIASSFEILIVSRVIQGVGATMILALGFAVATEAFPPEERGKAMGILASIVSLGVIIGPVIGGFLVTYASWRWIFFINLPIGFFGILMIIKFVPLKKNLVKKKFDIIGALFFFILMFTLLLGLSFAQKYGFTDLKTIYLLIASGICFAFFIIIEIFLKEPMLDLKMFKDYFLSANLFVTFLFYFAISGVFVIAPFYLQNILDYLPNQMGMLFGVMSFMMFFFSPISGLLSDKLGTSFVLVIALIIMLLSYFAVSEIVSTETSNFACILAMVVFGLGMGLFMSPNHSAVMGSISNEHLGIVSSLLILGRTLGQTAGVSILGAIWILRVKFYSGDNFSGVFETASKEARVLGLKEIFLFSCFLMLFSILLILIAEFKKRQNSDYLIVEN